MNWWYAVSAFIFVGMIAFTWVPRLRAVSDAALERWRPTQPEEARATHGIVGTLLLFAGAAALFAGLRISEAGWVVLALLAAWGVPGVIGWWRSKIALQGVELSYFNDWGKRTACGRVVAVEQVSWGKQLLWTKFMFEEDRYLRIEPRHFEVDSVVRLLEERGVPVSRTTTTFWKWAIRSEY